MKKFAWLLTLILALALVLSACGTPAATQAPAATEPPAEPTEAPATDAPAPTEAPATEAPAAAEPFRVAVVMPSAISDLAFSQSMYDALTRVQEEMGAENFEFV